MSSKHLTAPDPNEKGWPKGIKYIVGNEGAERFSYYGMRAILYMYLAFLIQQTGLEKSIADADAKVSYHLFVAGVYAFPILGALIADRLLGKYHTILYLSIVYCAGHACLAIFESSLSGIYVGLALIAIGSGGIKPCVSAHVGDQFGKSNWHLVSKVFQLFYFIINVGSFMSIILIPILKDRYGAGIAFGLPGILMALATIVFWMGRHDFVHVPANPGGKLGFLDVMVGVFLFVPLCMVLFATDAGMDSLWMKFAISGGAVAIAMMIFGYRQKIEEDDGFLPVLIYSIKVKLGFQEVPKAIVLGDEKKSEPGLTKTAIEHHWFFGSASTKFGPEAAEGPLAVLRIVSVFFLVSIFWMLFDQQSTSWLDQATAMDRELFGFEILSEQVTALNPILVMILIPITLWAFPALEKRGITLSPLRKMTIGFALTGVSFVAIALVQAKVESSAPGSVSIGWQLVPYVIITMGEVLVSITGLEFAYTQAPARMKSIVMGFWLLFVSIGNFLFAQLSHSWEGWALSKTFWVSAVMMFGATLIFGIRASFYTYKEYTQDTED